MEYPNLCHSFLLLASLQQKFRSLAPCNCDLEKGADKIIEKTCWARSSFHCDSHNSKSFHEWPTSPEIFAVPQLGWAIKKLRFSFQLPKRTSCSDNNDDDGTNYKTTRRNFTLGHQMPKTSIPNIPLLPPLQEVSVKIAESRRTFAESPINVNANCQAISWPVRSVLMFINWPAMAQLAAVSLAKMIRRLDLVRN